MNTICDAVLWSIWKNWNAMIFNNQTWLSLKQVWWLILRSLRKWRLIFKAETLERMDIFTLRLSVILKTPDALPWTRAWSLLHQRPLLLVQRHTATHLQINR